MNFEIVNFEMKQERTCIVCQKPIKINDGRNTKTCSAECSKTYRRIYDLLRHKK